MLRLREVSQDAVQHQESEQTGEEQGCPYYACSGIESSKSGIASKVDQPKPKFQILIKNQDELDKMAESFLQYVGPSINKTSHGTNTFSPYLVNKLLKT